MEEKNVKVNEFESCYPWEVAKLVVDGYTVWVVDKKYKLLHCINCMKYTDAVILLDRVENNYSAFTMWYEKEEK